jgi:hypothetical protein
MERDIETSSAAPLDSDATSRLGHLNLTREDVLKLAFEHYETLGDRGRRIALYLDENLVSVALDDIKTIARNCRVAPSSIVRFAQKIGLPGFLEISRIFRADLRRQLAESTISAEAGPSVVACQLVNVGDRPRTGNTHTASWLDCDNG